MAVGVKTIVHDVIGVDHPRGHEPIVGLEGLVPVVTIGWRMGRAVCELGSGGDVELVCDCVHVRVSLVPPSM